MGAKIQNDLTQIHIQLTMMANMPVGKEKREGLNFASEVLESRWQAD